MNKIYISFWRWFFVGSGASPGFCRLFTAWIIFDIVLAILIPFYSPSEKVYNISVAPVVSLVLGLVITCVFGSVSVYANFDLFKLSSVGRGGYFDFVYPYYLTIFISLFVSVYWVIFSIVELGRFGDFRVLIGDQEKYVSFWLCFGIFLVSFMIRTVWRTLLGVPLQVFYILKVKEYDKSSEE